MRPMHDRVRLGHYRFLWRLGSFWALDNGIGSRWTRNWNCTLPWGSRSGTVGCSIDKEHAKLRRRNSSRAASYSLSSMTSSHASQQSLQDEIADLEKRLHDAKTQLNQQQGVSRPPATDNAGPLSQHILTRQQTDRASALHALLLLSDSALPLGSFAFSSGLESYLAHHKLSPPSASQLPLFRTFLRLSLSTLASTALPYVFAGYRNPEDIETLDNDFDASTPCTVARRASIAQGRALLAVWDRSFKTQYKSSSGDADVPEGKQAAVDALIALVLCCVPRRTPMPITRRCGVCSRASSMSRCMKLRICSSSRMHVRL